MNPIGVIGAVLGVGVAVGMVLIVSAARRPSSPRASRRQVRRSSLGRLIESAGMSRISPTSVVFASALLAVVAAVLLLAATGILALAVLAGAGAAVIPLMLLRRRARQRAAALRTGWPDAVDILVSAVRAGMSLPEATADLARWGPEQLRPACAAMAAEYRATGSFTTALAVLKRELADPVADRVVASLSIAREVGGTDLGRVLTTLSEFLREDARTRGEIEARQSWTVNAARLAVAAPWITVAILCTRPEAVSAYASSGGFILLLGAGAMTVLAYRLMLRIGRLPVDPRVLQ